MKSTTNTFNGFSPKAVEFLSELELNNDNEWFIENRNTYETFILEPLRSLVTDLGVFMTSIDPYFETRPLVGKTISRIYRDARFSNDKSPLRSAMWITFKRPSSNWRDAPAYFFEITPRSYRYGMGYFNASKSTMDRFREMIDRQPEKFLSATSFFLVQDRFSIEGEVYKRTLDESKSIDILEWYQRRNLYLVCNREIDARLFSGSLMDDLVSGFDLISPLYSYLCALTFRELEY